MLQFSLSPREVYLENHHIRDFPDKSDISECHEALLTISEKLKEVSTSRSHSAVYSRNKLNTKFVQATIAIESLLSAYKKEYYGTRTNSY